LSGPRTATLGSEAPLTCNYIAKSGGGDHLYDSCIVDDGTTVCVNANLKGSGTACFTGAIITTTSLGIGLTACAKIQSEVGNTTNIGLFTSSGLAITSGGGSTGNIYQISFGYGGGTYGSSALYGLTESSTGYNSGALVFATRALTTDTAPIERMRIGSDGTKYFGTYNGSRIQVSASGENLYQYTNGYYIYGLFNDANSLSIESAFAGCIIFRTAAQTTSSSPTTTTERMRIMHNGSIIIQSSLGICNGGAINMTIPNNNNGGSIRMVCCTGANEGDMYFTGGAGCGILIAGSGKIGIGTTTPKSTLHIGPSLNSMPSATSIAVPGDTSIRFMAGSDGNADYGSYIGGTQYSGVRALSLGYRQGAGDVLTMTITQLSENNGGVGVGTTSPTANLDVNGSFRTISSFGKQYSQTSSSGTTSFVNTGIYYNTAGTGFANNAIYNLVISGNPNGAGSSEYRAVYLGYIFVTTGYDFGITNVVQRINYTQLVTGDPLNIGALTVSVVFWNGTTETNQQVNGTTNNQIRIKISGYNSGNIGAAQVLTLTKVN
jgi:hypothetical protein